jgi:hypothetical protein
MKNNNLKMFLWFFLCFCLSLPVEGAVVGDEVTVGGIRYKIKVGEASVIGVSNTSIATASILTEVAGCPVTSIGAVAFANCYDLTSVTLPASLTSIDVAAFMNCSNLSTITIPKGVISIGTMAFMNCSNLSSITIPEGVTSIGDGAFAFCSNLSSITIPKGVTSIGNAAFAACSNLSSITIPDGVISIGDDAFAACSNLSSITIPDGVISIGDDAFSHCQGLISVTLPASLTSIGDGAFTLCSNLSSITIPEGVTSIGDGCFSECTGLKEILVSQNNVNFVTVDGVLFNTGMTTLLAFPAGKNVDAYVVPETVTTIAVDAFIACYGLTSVTLPASLISIGAVAFIDCYGLTSVNLPANLISIGEGAFLGCGLTSIKIPASVTDIGDYAFACCYNLTSIAVAEDNENFVVVDGVLFNSEKTRLLSYPAGKAADAYVVPNTVAVIDNGAFYGCEDMSSIILPEGITYIGNYVFYGCTNLTSVSLPETLTYIGVGAFEGCSSLTSLVIPNGVTSIEDYAFYDCTALTTVFTDSDYVADWFATNMPNVAIRPLSEYGYGDDQPLPEAKAIVTGQGVTMTTGGDAPWFLQEGIFHSAPSAMQSGAIDHEGVSRLTARVTGPGVLSFYWKVSSESGYDFLSFSVDGVVKDAISGETNWVQSGCHLGEGEHEVSWTYAKDYGDSDGGDCGWVDDIVWPDNDYVPTNLAIDGIRYYIKNGEASVIGVSSTSIATANILAEVAGCPVASIGEGAFFGCDNLIHVTIPEGVTSIGERAFGACSSLAEIVVSEDNKDFVSVDGVLFNAAGTRLVAYPAGKVNETYAVPATVTHIEPWAFFMCEKLTDVFVPYGVSYIGDQAFDYCTNLTSIIISNGVTEIGYSPFYDSLETVFTDNEHVADWFYYNMPNVSIRPFSESGYDDLHQPLPEAGAIVTGVGVTMTTGGDAPWFLQEDIFHSAPSAMQSGAIGSNGGSMLTARVTGPGVLSFYWKVSSEQSWERDDYLCFIVDGTIQKSIAGKTDWTQIGCVLDEGEHDVSWIYMKNYMGDYYENDMPHTDFDGDDCGWVDDIVWPDNDYVPPYDIVSGGIVYRIANGEATVTGLKDETITDVVIPEKVDGHPVTAIDADAFEYSGLYSITISASVTDIYSYAFAGCYNLTSIAVAEDNENFVVVDGVLFNAEKTRLLSYPAGKTADAYVVPKTVADIDNGAFYGCENLSDIILPDGITYIGEGAFAYCTNLTSVSLPETLTYIGLAAFYHCSSLTTLIIPNGVTSISEIAFDGCQALSTVFTDSEYVADWFAEHMPGTVILPRGALAVSVQCPLAVGWNLVGIPLSLDAASKDAISAYRPLVCDYSAKTNTFAETDYAPGTVVWLFATKDDTLVLKGTPVQSVGTVLLKGWNLVSPLYGETANPGLDHVWYLTPEGMHRLTTDEGVEPGTSYWIYSDEPQTIW